MIIIIRDNKHPVEEYMTDNWLWWRDGIIYQIYRALFKIAITMALATCAGSFNGWTI
jgi:hypothetical protein